MKNSPTTVKESNMCKKLIMMVAAATLYLAASHASAVDVAYLQNTSGGKIIFTDTRSEVCGDDGYAAMATTSEGQVYFGCYYPLDNYILVKWPDNQTRIYEYTALTPYNTGIKRYGK
jgi:hypothetical protein